MRRLSAEEGALWAKVIATVQPLHPRADLSLEPDPPAGTAISPKPTPRPRPAPSIAPAKTVPGTTLDGTWDRRLAKGSVQPDMIVDLHGRNLASAYGFLDDSLERAVRSGARLLLLITGHPPKGEPPVARGRIRAAMGDWLAASPHAGKIAAIRSAHARHGGGGALYIVLRRSGR